MTSFAPVPDGRQHRQWVLATLCLSLVMVVAANSGLNVALPTLARRIGATHTQLQWMVDAYSVVFAALLLPLGAMGDRLGRRRVLLAGLVLFAAASAWATTASTPTQVVASRAVMGAAAAGVMPATLSILTVVFPPKERGWAIAVWSGMAGAGAAIGPLASGLLLERFWWGSVFLVNVPIAIVAVAGVLAVVPTVERAHRAPIDVPGAALAIMGLGGVVYAIIEAPSRGIGDPTVVLAMVGGACVLGLFAVWQARSAAPLVGPTWWQRSVLWGAGCVLVAFLTLIALMFLITQYFQFVLGYSALLAAAAALPVAAMMLVVAPRSARLVARFGAGPTIAAGLFALAVGLGWVALVATPEAHYLPIGLGVALVGVGLAVSTPPATTLILEGFPPERAGVGSAINDVTRELGAALGVALLGSVLSGAYRAGIEVDQLSTDAADSARLSISGAFATASQLPDTQAAALITSARQAFTSGFAAALLVGAVVVAAMALTLWRARPVEETSDDGRAPGRAEAAMTTRTADR